MIDLIVYNQEPVMCLVEFKNIDRGVLCIVSSEIQLKLFWYLLCVDSGLDTLVTFVQQSQNWFVYIVINQYQFPMSAFDQVGNKHIGIEYLSIEEDALYGSKWSFYKEIDLTRYPTEMMTSKL